MSDKDLARQYADACGANTPAPTLDEVSRAPRPRAQRGMQVVVDESVPRGEVWLRRGDGRG